MSRSEENAGWELVDSRDAVWNYLDALLQDIPEGSDSALSDSVPQADAGRAGAVAQQVTAEAPRSPPLEQQEADLAAPLPSRETEMALSSEVLPEWRKSAFQALFFHVGGLRLAVPLTELHSVVPWGDVDVTPLPNRPNWFLGLMPYRHRKVRVIDTAAMVLPENKRIAPEAQAAPAHVLVVGDGSWGLVCHGVGDVIRLQPDEVKWRTGQGKRRWLAGTVIGHLSALVDTSAFTDMLAGRGPVSRLSADRRCI